MKSKKIIYGKKMGKKMYMDTIFIISRKWKGSKHLTI